MAIGPEVKAYKVKKEDNLWNIVKTAGFPPKDWEKILNAPYNRELKATLKKEKRSPDKIQPGETIYLPAFNSKDIMKKFESVKEMRTSVGDSLKYLAKLDYAISGLRDEKAEDIKNRKIKLKALEKECKKLNDAIMKDNSPGPMEGPGEKARQLWTKTYLRHTEGVYDMQKEIAFMTRTIESSKFTVSIRKLENFAKSAQKDLNITAKELQKGEKELQKMLKKPY